MDIKKILEGDDFNFETLKTLMLDESIMANPEEREKLHLLMMLHTIKFQTAMSESRQRLQQRRNENVVSQEKQE